MNGAAIFIYIRLKEYPWVIVRLRQVFPWPSGLCRARISSVLHGAQPQHHQLHHSHPSHPKQGQTDCAYCDDNGLVIMKNRLCAFELGLILGNHFLPLMRRFSHGTSEKSLWVCPLPFRRRMLQGACHCRTAHAAKTDNINNSLKNTQFNNCNSCYGIF